MQRRKRNPDMDIRVQESRDKHKERVLDLPPEESLDIEAILDARDTLIPEHIVAPKRGCGEVPALRVRWTESLSMTILPVTGHPDTFTIRITKEGSDGKVAKRWKRKKLLKELLSAFEYEQPEGPNVFSRRDHPHLSITREQIERKAILANLAGQLHIMEMRGVADSALEELENDPFTQLAPLSLPEERSEPASGIMAYLMAFARRIF